MGERESMSGRKRKRECEWEKESVCEWERECVSGRGSL